MLKPYPREFRNDVVRVARNRDPKTPLSHIASDLGIHQTALNVWMCAALDGRPPSPADVEELNYSVTH